MRLILPIAILLLTACNTVSAPTPEPMPDLQPTIDALEREIAVVKQEAAIARAEDRIAQNIARSRELRTNPMPATPLPTIPPTPVPTPVAVIVPTALPTPTPTPTAIPTPTPRPTPRPTATPRPTDIPTPTRTLKPIDVGELNWIDRELVLTGQLPLIPEWMWGTGPENPFVHLGPGKRWATLGDRIGQGQELAVLSAQAWCRLKPTERLKLMEYTVWLGNNIYDWLDQQYGIRGAWNRCPPAGSY